MVQGCLVGGERVGVVELTEGVGGRGGCGDEPQVGVVLVGLLAAEVYVGAFLSANVNANENVFEKNKQTRV